MTARERAKIHYYANKASILEKRRLEYRANPLKFKSKSLLYQAANKTTVAARRRAYYVARKTQISEWHAQYRKKNEARVKTRKAKYSASHKEAISQAGSRYRATNRKRLATIRAAKLKSNPSFRAACRIRSMLCRAVERGGGKKAARATELLGCSIPFFMDFIAAKFADGMCWGNHGEWHLDHIVPLTNFGDMTMIENQKRANHYTNFQPLWALANLSKGAS